MDITGLVGLFSAYPTLMHAVIELADRAELTASDCLTPAVVLTASRTGDAGPPGAGGGRASWGAPGDAGRMADGRVFLGCCYGLDPCGMSRLQVTGLLGVGSGIRSIPVEAADS